MTNEGPVPVGHIVPSGALIELYAGKPYRNNHISRIPCVVLLDEPSGWVDELERVSGMTFDTLYHRRRLC